jgi:hypothetical protein
MKKTLFWAAAGLALATVCGLAGLPHLSAATATLTFYLAAPLLLVGAIDALPWRA